LRARWVKPEFFKDRKIGALGCDAAIVYQSLWCMSDDAGVAKGSAEEIKGEMLLWWPELDVDAIRAALVKLEGAHRITGYEIGDDQYWVIHTLIKHQGKIHQPSAFRHPGPGGRDRKGTSTPPIVVRQSATESPNPPPVNDLQGTTAGIRQESGSGHHLYTYIPQHLDTQIPEHLDTHTPGVEEDPREFSLELIKALNQGMHDNPLIGEKFTAVQHGHGASLTATEEIIAAGVPPEFARQAVYDVALAFKPETRNRQIRSVGYCTDSVITAWQRAEASTAARDSSRPARTPKNEPLSKGEQGYANAKLVAQENSR
jgi:hypothetical protein